MEERVRRCPIDREPLKRILAGAIEIDACPACEGIWLDRGELESLAKGFHGADLRAIRGPGSFATGPRACPACGRKLVPLRYGAGQRSVIIDRCLECGGLWLDREELGAVSRWAGKVREIATRPIPQAKRPAIEREDEWSGRVLLSALLGIPVELDNPRRRTPWITWSLIAINLLIFIAQAASGGASGFIEAFGMSPRGVLEEGRVHTLFTSFFIHASLIHLLGNMAFLYVFGDNVEDRFGSIPYAILYVVFGLLANVVGLLLSPARAIPSVGASGAISGIMGCYLVFFPRSQLVTVLWVVWRPYAFRVAAWLYLGVWVLLQLFGAAGQGEGGGIDYLAHAAGFGAGLAAGIGFGLVLRALEGPEETRPAGARIR